MKKCSLFWLDFSSANLQVYSSSWDAPVQPFRYLRSWKCGKMLSFVTKELGSTGRYVRVEFRVLARAACLCAFSLLTLLLPAVHLYSFLLPHPPKSFSVFFLVVSLGADHFVCLRAYVHVTEESWPNRCPRMRAEGFEDNSHSDPHSLRDSPPVGQLHSGILGVVYSPWGAWRSEAVAWRQVIWEGAAGRVCEEHPNGVMTPPGRRVVRCVIHTYFCPGQEGRCCTSCIYY